MVIHSLDNAQFKLVLKLQESKYRKKYGLFLIEGEHLIQEALKYNRLETLILQEDALNSIPFKNILIFSKPLMTKLSQTVSHTSIMGICRIEEEEISNPQRILICERIQDPGNLGTLIRTACAFGFDQVICSLDCVDLYNEKVIRSTQGALFQIPIQVENIERVYEELKTKGIRIFGTGFKNSTPLSQLKIQFPCAIVLGNEGKGLSDFALTHSDELILIEMNQFDSLNVAIAGSILMYQFRKG